MEPHWRVIAALVFALHIFTVAQSENMDLTDNLVTENMTSGPSPLASNVSPMLMTMNTQATTLNTTISPLDTGAEPPSSPTSSMETLTANGSLTMAFPSFQNTTMEPNSTATHDNATQVLDLITTPAQPDSNATDRPDLITTPAQPDWNATEGPNVTDSTVDYNATDSGENSTIQFDTPTPMPSVMPTENFSTTPEFSDSEPSFTTTFDSWNNTEPVRDLSPEYEQRRGGVALGAIIGTALGICLLGLAIYILLKNRKSRDFNHRRLYDDNFPSSDPVLRLEPSVEPLDLRYGGTSAYYNPERQGDHIQMSNFPRGKMA
ncbi:MUC15 protein, partial [Amia calva]|nr:MUC15 protein [Amia calva]